MLLVSNTNLAGEMYRAMEAFYCSPDISYMEIKNNAVESYVSDLAVYLKRNREETIILCDTFASTAFNEAAIMIQKMRRAENTALICGMNLPMVFKVYGLKDQWSLELIKSAYRDMQQSGIVVFEGAETVCKEKVSA